MIRKRAKAAVGALVVMSGLVSAEATAHAGDDENHADALFREAREAMARSDFQTACPRFAESYKLDPAAGTLLNLGDCEQRRGNLAAAWTAFRDAQRLLSATDARAAYALKRAAALETRLARLTVTLAPSVPKNAEVLRDGGPLGSEAIGAAVAIDPGRHALVLRAPGHVDARIDLTLHEGESRMIELAPGPETNNTEPVPAPVVARPRATPKEEPHESNALPIAAIGGGGALLILGATTGFMVLDSISTYRSHCKDGLCDSDGSDAATRGKVLGIVSPVALLAGAAGIGFGIYTLAKSPSGKTTGARVVPSISSRDAGMSIEGIF